jgi:predicted enzyme related to lactoylglutathione lyase
MQSSLSNEETDALLHGFFALMGKIVNFYFPADDVERAAAFYREVFGWEFAPYPNSPVPFAVLQPSEDAAGIPGAITQRNAFVKAPTPTIRVDDIDQAMAALAMNGGQQGAVQDIAGFGRFGYAIDSEGNIIGLLQPESPK